MFPRRTSDATFTRKACGWAPVHLLHRVSAISVRRFGFLGSFAAPLVPTLLFSGARCRCGRPLDSRGTVQLVLLLGSWVVGSRILFGECGRSSVARLEIKFP